ncbi:pyrophosphatase PpaX [Jeotgalibacillus haloalkalitolerans]|uniref:Pyrophosphatase PpaX n=1 Tax=Jeotgalibacillus haloalkalitolerans TaxID=3104292 RepID=A0ABU5KJU2_9BACL|nr:pyrophosphatase PpaX [Jeotgalibacillus sp. HH7-29]MDZ5711518.1 pyrophosphatase PpaX [Jeotgalibacillus sp. HH7-29]
MNKRIDTVLFDLDGTLINTNELIISSFMHVMDHYYPGEYSREDVLQFMGPPLVESFQALNPEKTEEMVDFYRAYNLKVHDELVTPFEGVDETVKELYDRGIKMAIVSTKRHDMVVRGLKLMNLDQYFDVVIGLDDVEHAKPHPEPLYKALEALGSTADQAIMVGDNHHDIEGGQNAGTRTAGVAWTSKGKAHLETYKPDFMLEEMSDLLKVIEESGS